MIAVHDVLWGDALLAGTNGNGYTMFVRTANEHHVLLFQTQVAHVDIGRDIDTCQVTDVYTTISVRQC